jgi:hypothetical protein
LVEIIGAECPIYIQCICEQSEKIYTYNDIDITELTLDRYTVLVNAS